jgi:putative hydrolase of the HAD superfamily
MVKAVFFDAAGTIFDAKEPVGHTYAAIAAKHGLGAEAAKVTAGFRRAFSSAPGLAFGPGHSDDELRHLEREWWRVLVRESFAGLGEFRDFDAFFDELFSYFGNPDHWAPAPQAHAVFERLRDLGLKVGIISNFDHRLYGILEGLGLRRFFDSVTISSEAGFSKPARQIFIAALASLGVDAAEAVHVGDSEHMDFRGALAAGLGAILIDAAAEPFRTKERHPNAVRVAALGSVIGVVQNAR